MAAQLITQEQKKDKGCLVPWCDSKYFARGYCQKHYNQVYRCKAIFLKIRSHLTPNEFILNGDTCWINLYNQKCEKVAETIIDSTDIELCKTRKWHLRNDYVESTHPTRVMLQNFLFDHNSNRIFVVDHRDRNPLNNIRSNLRLCTASQNCINKRIQSNNVSGITGVCYDKSRCEWIAQINYDKGHKNLGRFANKVDAIIARKIAEKIYHGNFCPK